MHTSKLKILVSYFVQFNQIALALLVFTSIFFITQQAINFKAINQVDKNSLIEGFYLNSMTLEHNINSPTHYMAALRNELETYLQLQNSSPKYLPENYKYDNKKEYFHSIYKPQQGISNHSFTMGNFKLPVSSTVLNKELQSVTLISKNFHHILESFPNVYQIYYISQNKFYSSYPNINADHFTNINELYLQPFFQYGTPRLNPKKEPYWTHFSQTKNEYLITYGTPIYQGDTFMGVLAIDLSLNFLSQVSGSNLFANPKYFLLNNHNEILHTTTDGGSSNTEIIQVPKLSPYWIYLKEFITLPNDTIIQYSNMELIQYNLHGTPWRYGILFQKPNTISQFIRHFGLEVAIFIAGLSIIFIMFFFFIRNNLVHPISKLAYHIQTLSEMNDNEDHKVDGLPRHWVPLFEIITRNFSKVKRYQQDLLNQFYMDNLTNLPNRNKLHYDIGRQSLQSPALFIVDIDSFKDINDYYGTQIGDAILIQIKEFISQQFASGEWTLYRTSGDEFALLAEKNISTDDAEILAEKFIETSNKHIFKHENYRIRIRFSVGICFDHSNMLRKADIALIQCKKSRKHYLIFDQSLDMEQQFSDNIKWTDTIYKALETENFVPFFQPIYNNSSGKIEKFECLIRLIDQDNKIIPPFFFMNVAIKNKQYPLLSRIMIEKSFHAFQNTSYEFSLNLSAHDILNEETVKLILRKLKTTGLGKQVVFELLESDGIENYEEVVQFIRKVKEYGCKIAIDDFGTGYSNFEHIMRMEIDYLKIDGSLIKNIVKDKNHRIFLETIVDFAKKMKIKLVAEFVADEEIFNLLKQMNIEYSQGFYIGKPEADIITKPLFQD